MHSVVDIDMRYDSCVVRKLLIDPNVAFGHDSCSSMHLRVERTYWPCHGCELCKFEHRRGLVRRLSSVEAMPLYAAMAWHWQDRVKIR